MAGATDSIKITVALWPYGLDPDDPKALVEKEAWENGSVYLTKNTTHGIKQTGPTQFKHLADLEEAIRTLLAANGITVRDKD